MFVTGGSSGINLGIADAFARARRHGRDPQPHAGALDSRASSSCARHGARREGYSADVRDAAAVDDALKQAHARFGPIDVLVSGAAGNFLAPALGMSANGFKTVIDIDLLGSFNVLRGAHRVPAQAGRVGHQHLGVAGLRADAVPGACVRGQGRRRHADARAGDGVGRRRHPRQLDRAGADRGHRGHAAGSRRTTRSARA